MRDGMDAAESTGATTSRAAATTRRSGRGRIAPGDLAAFRRTLDAATRRALVTPVIVLISGAYFAAMVAVGVPIGWPSAPEMVRWGANDGGRLVLRHEFWRLVVSVFLHGGILHLVVNMWGLLMIGPLVERIHGPLAFGVLYLAAGVGGAIASVAVPPIRVSVGASGAICGVLGGLLAFLVQHRRAIPPTVLAHLARNVAAVVVVMAVLGAAVANMAVLGAAVANIDQAAHLGGLATGFVCGLLLIGPWPVPTGSRRRLLARRLAITAAIAAAMALAAVAVAHRGEASIPPARRLDDLADRLAPLLHEFNAIRKDLAHAIAPDDDNLDLDVPDRGAAVAAMGRLGGRAQALADGLAAVRADAPIGREPELSAIVADLARAMAALVDRLGALARYLETGDRAALVAAREAQATTIEAVRECEGHRHRYLVRFGLDGGG